MILIDNVKNMQKIQNEYLLKNEYELTENIMKYIKERIEVNRKEIEELIKKQDEKITVDEIIELIKNEEEIYKNYRNFKINSDFLSVEIDMPIGVIAVECYETLETIKYLIKGIKTRNAIIISDVEYDEYNVKSMILLIIKEAIKKFGIEENIINILPYDECYYELFDEVIYTYNEEGELLKEPIVEKKEYGTKKYVYIENEKLKEEALKNEDAEIIDGEFEEIIEKIGKEDSAIIYTENKEKAFKFINLVKCKNVFVNSNIINREEFDDSKNSFFETKHIIIPIPKNEKEIIKEEEKYNDDSKKKEKSNEIEIDESINIIEKENSNNKNEKLEMIIKKESIFDKIKRILKNLFG